MIFLNVLILKNVKQHLENTKFNYGPYLCDGCYDMSMKAVSMQNLTIINHNGNDYRVNFAFMSKIDAYGLVKNAVIMGEKGTL